MTDKREEGQEGSRGPLQVMLWSTPRSHSTALAYAWGHRSDTAVLDEPLYASWLHRSGVAHQGRELVLAAAPSLQQSELLAAGFRGDLDRPPRPQPPRVRFWKHMAKHYAPDEEPAASRDASGAPGWWTQENVRHVFLVREPWRIVRSWSQVEPVQEEEIGFRALLALHQQLVQAGCTPLLLDAKYLALDPEGVLEALCGALSLPWAEEREAMLHWPAGPRPFDIANARYWYQAVWASTGFHPYRAEDRPPEPRKEVQALVEELQALYAQLDVAHQALRRTVRPAYVGVGQDAHDVLPDARNGTIQVWVSDLGGLVPRERARVSVFDSAVQGGDQVWEGLRVYEGRIFALDYHIHRLLDSAAALGYQGVPSAEAIEQAVVRTLEANGMRDGVHIRLTLTRGTKVTSSMNPLFNRAGCTLLVVAEWKDPVYNAAGVRLITSAVRRNTPAILDSKIHHGNMLHLILAKMQANAAGVDDALMLDVDGFVAETNACNLFAVIRPVGHPHKRVLVTPLPDACLNGITRQIVLELAREGHGGFAEVQERRVSLSEFHCALEVFVTGSMGGLISVVEIDSRPIGPSAGDCPLAQRYPCTHSLQSAYTERWLHTGHILPF